MPGSVTAFRPLSHGFRFVNRFTVHLSLPLPLVGSVDLGDLVVGLCGGMCFTALDYFHAGIAIPPQRALPQPGSKLYKHLLMKQVESLVPPDGVVKVLAWTAADDRYVFKHTAGRELRKLRSRLDKGEPAVLALIRVGRGEDPGKNHQVVARAYTYDEGSGRVQVRLYDPNHPESEPRLSMNASRPHQGIGAKQSTGEFLRGFFVIDYSPGDIPDLRRWHIVGWHWLWHCRAMRELHAGGHHVYIVSPDEGIRWGCVKELPLDDTGEIVLLSDCHWGDNSRADNFPRIRMSSAQMRHQELFATTHYWAHA